jgi:hypothetical protein
VGPRAATGSPLERSLPEPPDWRQFVALAASRRAEELNRLLDLADRGSAAPAAVPATTEPAAGGPPAQSHSRPADPHAILE